MRMTSRERFRASLRGGVLDRFFRYEHGPWPTTRERWVQEGYPAEANFGDHFEMDPIARIAINSGYCASPYEPRFEETTVEEDEGYRVYVDADGILKRELATRRDTSMPQFLKFPVESREDWRGIRERLDPADAAARIGDVERLKQQCSDSGVPTMLPMCGAFGHPRNLLGDEGLSYLIFDDPALLDEILENWRNLYVELIRALTTIIRVDSILIWEDMCYRNGPLISPAHFRRFLLPRYIELIAAARECGVEGIIVDTDGDCLELIPLFLEAGADCLMPFEVQAGMDVVAIAAEFPELSIMGGIDKRALAADKAAIKAEVERVVPHFLGRGRFIPTLDHTVPPNVPLESFQYYMSCLRQYEDKGE